MLGIRPPHFLGFSLSLLLAGSLMAADLAAIRRRLEALTQQHEGLGMSVATLGGQEIFDFRGGEARIPASNAKIATAALALHTLGADYEFKTTLHRRGRLLGGTIDGDLVVRGGGDPSLSSRFRGDGVSGLLGEWAKKLSAQGVRAISGDLVLDDRLFDQEDRHSSWPANQKRQWYAAGVAALNLGDGCLEVSLERDGARVKARVEPALRGYTTVVDMSFVAAQSEHAVHIDMDTAARRITVRGKFWEKAPVQSYFWAVDDPCLLFGDALGAALEAQGIVIAGQVRRAKPDENLGSLPLLASETTPLRTVLGVVLKRSQNLYAESVYKACGAAKAGQGSFASGAQAAEEFFAKVGVSMKQADGSGLSRANAYPPKDVVKLLTWISQQGFAEDFYALLPASGVDGTLDDRLTRFKGRVLAKTGTLNGVSALSGYAILDGETLVFSILMNNPRLGAAAARDWQDKLVGAFFEP